MGESRRRRGRKAAVTSALCAALLTPAVAQVGPAPGAAGMQVTAAEARQSARGDRQPNIVVFVTDDLSSDLLRHMPYTRRLIFRQGARFNRFHANVPLCCPARATLLTGKYAHNTGVVGNSYPYGFHGFHTNDERNDTVAVALRRRADYRTALLGKYLNEYPYVNSQPELGVSPTYVPNGWSDWAVPVDGAHHGNDYRINLDGRVVHRYRRKDYLSDFLTRRADSIIRDNEDGRGLALFLTYYEPHAPEPASPIEKRNDALLRQIASLQRPRTPDFDEADVSDKPPVIRRAPPLTQEQIDDIDRVYRRRVLSVQTVDRHVAEVVRSLRRSGQLSRTYLVFTSDHGYHLGAHRLAAGKNTAYLPDARVPFAIRGPGIAPGTTVDALTGNIDVAPTLAQMAGTRLPYVHDGESLLPLARGRTPSRWRQYFLIHRGRPGPTAEPSRRLERRAPEQPGFTAVMGERWEYVRHADGFEELYDLEWDPFQLENLLARPVEERTEAERAAHAELSLALERLRGCSGVVACRGSVSP